MPRETEVRIDCAKLRQRLLTDCGFTVAGAEDKMNIPHSVLHRMLGGPRRAPKPWANVRSDHVKTVVGLVRKTLKTEFTIEDLLWVEADPEAPATEPKDEGEAAFDILLDEARAFHMAAMANRDLAVRVYGQALTPLDAAAPPPVARVAFLDALEEALRHATPVRRSESVQTEIAGAPVLVQGEEGVGKTWLVAQWWLDGHTHILFLYLPASRFRGVEVNPEEVVFDELCSMVSRERLDQDGADAWRRKVRSEGFRRAALGRMVIMIDGINEAPDADWPVVLEALWLSAQRLGARLMVTSRPGFWRRRERELAQGPLQDLATVRLLGFSRDEFEEACRLAGQDPAAIPADLVDRLSNPRVFRLAMLLMPSLRRQADFGIDRLLYAYWGRRQDERADLRRLDPDRDAFLQGLARHAEEFHDRRLKAARAGAVDLDTEDVAFAVDEVGARFRGLNRYRPADSAAAAILIGEIREGRFFDDDPLAPGGAYVFRRGSLAFALGLYLVHALMDYVREHRSRLDLDDLRERLALLLEPVLDFDQTADQVIAAVTSACLDPIVTPQVRKVLLEQFLDLRNRPSHLKSVLAALALEAPETFCEVAQRALDDFGAERIDSWLLAALRYMNGAGVGQDWVRSWIVSPTDEEVGLLWGQHAEVADDVVARRRQTLGAMVVAGQALAPFAAPLCDWALVATGQPAVTRRREPQPPFCQTPMAQVIRFNDCDPEALTQAILACEKRWPGGNVESGRRAVAALMALIASPEALAQSQARDPDIIDLVDRPDDLPIPPWHEAADPGIEPTALAKAFGLSEKLLRAKVLDPFGPEDEALLAVTARFDSNRFGGLVRPAFNALISVPPKAPSVRANDVEFWPEEPYQSRAKSLAVLAETCTSAIGQGPPVTLAEAKSALKVVKGSATRLARDAAEEREQVVATLLAATSEKARHGLLRALRQMVGLRTKAREPIWRPTLSAETAVAAIQEALSDWEAGAPGRRLSAGEFVAFLAAFPIGAGASSVVERLVTLGLGRKTSPDAAHDEGFPAALTLAGQVDPAASSALMLEKGWRWAYGDDAVSGRQISAMMVRHLAGRAPLGSYADRVCAADLPLAAEEIGEDELPMLVDLIEHELVSNRGNALSAPTSKGAARLQGVRTDWIADHIAWHTRTIAKLIEGSHPTTDELAAVAITASPEPIEGERAYIAALLRRGRVSREASSQRLFKPALAAAARSPSPADILDPLIFKITDDRILAALVRDARDLGGVALAAFDAHVTDLSRSRVTIRAAYGLTLSALRERIDEKARQGFLKAVADHGRMIAEAHWRAHHWANQRLTKGDSGAEYLALSIMSKPLPGSFDRLALSKGSGPLEALFLRRLVEKAEKWGYDTLFGQPTPPKWLFAHMPDA